MTEGSPTDAAIAVRWPIGIATLAFIAACMIYLALHRAGWLDEYWTVWHSDPVNSLRTAYWTRWVRDTPHPPTFYALAWTLGDLTGKTLAIRRLVDNSTGLLLVTATVIACRRNGVLPLPTFLFSIVLASGPYFITYFAEHRSYFLALCATACLVSTTRAVHVASDDGTRLPRRTMTWFVLISVIAVNLHYTIALSGLALLLCEAIWQWFWGSRNTALLVVAAALIALTPLMLDAAIALSLRQPLPVVVYVPAIKGLVTILLLLVVGPAANIVLLARALLSLRALFREPSFSHNALRRSFLLVLAGTLAILLVVFVAGELLKHNIVPRLLLGLIPPAVAGFCELAAWTPIGPRWFALACANAAIAAAVTTTHELHNPRWEYHAPAILDAVRACPQTRVVAISPLVLAPPNSIVSNMPGQEQAVALSYRMIAKKFGFSVTVEPEDGQVPRSPTHCPTLIWLEHNFFRPDVKTEELVTMARLPAPRSEKVKRDHFESHDLVEIAP